MELIRTIHPVGQGAFYTETLKEGNEEINVAYDCGGKSQTFMRQYLDKNICNSFDLVFVSHFHYDHINGLVHLLDNFKVGFLIIPQLEWEVLLESLLYNYMKSGFLNNKVNQFLLYIYDNDMYHDTPLIHISPGSLEEESTSKKNGAKTLFSSVLDIKKLNQAQLKTVKNGFAIGFNEWFYIPYNPPLPIKIKKNGYGSFYDFFKDSLNEGKDFDINDLKKIIKKGGAGLSEVKSNLKKYFIITNDNQYSMAVYSGKNKHKKETFKKCRECCDNLCRAKCQASKILVNPTFLYTGDFDVNGKYNNKTGLSLLKCYYGDLLKRVQDIQVPHHGSWNNFAEELYIGVKRSFISAGSNNKYNHPDKLTIKGVRKQGGNCVVVTEDESTKCSRSFLV